MGPGDRRSEGARNRAELPLKEKFQKMSNSEIFLDGLKITVLGMGWVFLFLVVMIQMMKLLSAVLAPFTKREEEAAAAAAAAEKAKRAAKASAGSSDDADLAAVAAVAVARSLAK